MDNRERILDAARQVYAVHGFRGATTRRIAQEAGVNEVTVFRLFGSKAQLIGEIRRAVFDAHGVPVLPEEPGDPEGEVTAWCRDMLDMLTANRSVVRKMMSEVEEDPEAGEVACHGPLCAKEHLERYVLRLAESGRTAPDADPRTSMTMLMSALFGDAMTREMMPDVKPPYADAPRLYTRAFLRSLGMPLPPPR